MPIKHRKAHPVQFPLPSNDVPGEENWNIISQDSDTSQNLSTCRTQATSSK